MTGIVALLAGLAVGSFVNLCIDRLPAGESLLRPRSRCDACHRPLAIRDLLPLVSYFMLRGHCRYCGAPISLRVPVLETGAGLIFLGLWWRFGLAVGAVAGAATACVAVVVGAIALERPHRHFERKASHDRRD